ncbi:MAG TPA: hypothetical protein VNO75_02620 [Gemmatimonadaceae bacterium]|nr:hypothetical protein [Gemmatimonadaceae bacterium]
MKLLLGCVLGLTLAACNEPTSFNRRTLPLALVNDAPIPVTLPSGAGTVEVISGTIQSNLATGICNWTVNLSGGISRTGTVPECVFFLDQNFSVTLDMGGPPAPDGPHLYEFGVVGG